MITYDREVLVDILVYHYRDGFKGCGCGWGELGRSWPEHVATVYEESVAAREQRSLMSGHLHVWTYHQPATCDATPVWHCAGPDGCGLYQTQNPDPFAGPTIVAGDQ